MEKKQFVALICDADVLIDYVSSNKQILEKVSLSISSICVPSPILGEVRQLSKKEAKELKIKIFEPELSDIITASERGGRLSFEDKLCLISAGKNNWTCVTNDKNLRKACEERKIDILWGLDLMLLLNEAGMLSEEEAQNTAEKIKENNAYIKKDIVDSFLKKLK